MLLPDFLSQAADVVQRFLTINPAEPFKTGVKLVSMAGTAVTVTAVFVSKTYPWIKTKYDSRSISKSVGAKLFSVAGIERSLKYYIPPYCQSVDPAGGEESRLIHSVQARLFDTLDNVLSKSSKERYHILLADSGMGKTSALLNYYARHIHRWRKPSKLAIVPLGIADADEKIKAIDDKENTALFLDAFDEDTLAMVDHTERLRLILKETGDFYRVLITSRTQFFARDEEIPKETGVMKVAAREAGESAEYVFYKIYLTPFTDQQVSAYLKKRYPLWHRKKRKRAFEMATKIPHLTARPMLLAHIDDLVRAQRDIHHSYELYEEMVEAWIKREQGFVENPDELRRFSELLAVDLYVNRQARGSELIKKLELMELAKAWQITILDDKLSGRSLLNRDADGNFKFAHRSILEYLFVKRFTDGDTNCRYTEWTDNMRRFLAEMISCHVSTSKALPFDLEGADLAHFLEADYTPPKSIRSKPRSMSTKDIGSRMNSLLETGDDRLLRALRYSDAELVLDLSHGIFWQQAGSSGAMRSPYVDGYIQQLNAERFGGFDDWRLPTWDEVTGSLWTGSSAIPFKGAHESFDARQRLIWTSDTYGGGQITVPVTSPFSVTEVIDGIFGHNGEAFVRAVRSKGQ